MKKNFDKDTAGNSEGFFNSELLFCTDSTVVDYLNALLESEPARNMDFREIHFVHQEVNSNSNTTALIGNTMLFNAEYSKIEVDELRSENEKLKFRTELAEIDTQVLRTENSKLKIEKEHLIAQLLELEDKINTVFAQNGNHRQTVETAHQQLKPPVINIEHVGEDEKTNSPPCAEQPADEKINSDSEQTVQHEIPKQEPQPEPEPETVIEECRNDVKKSILIDQERLIISRVTVQNNAVKKLNSSDSTFSSQKSSGGRVSRQDALPFSKVIKQHPVEKKHPRQTGHILKATSPDEIPRDHNYEADKRQNFVQQHHVPEVENCQEADAPVSITAVELLKNVDEIDMPPAPDPKVVTRRNVKNYEDLQNESNSKKTIEAGHTLIL